MESSFSVPLPVSLYLHYPWCIAKCPYCDFNSHERKAKDDTQTYVKQLISDVRSSAERIAGPLTSIYFGGGTPSLMQPSEVQRVLAAVADSFELPDEVTLESNPGTFERDKFRAFRDAGITRLSVGVQSFQSSKLRALGRVHDADEARRAVASACEIFDHVNVDLMYGLPGQSIDDALFDLESAVGMGVGHLSWYQLTIEPSTVFYRRPPVLPIECDALAMESAGLERLDAAGLRRYEISAFAKDGERCRHNLNYWQFGDYLGIGAGAHGKLSSAGRILRTSFARQPRRYVGGESDRYREEAVPDESLAVEFMMNALRLIDGVDEMLFETRTGVPLSRIAETLDALRNQGFMHRERLCLSARGAPLLDSVIAEFLD